MTIEKVELKQQTMLGVHEITKMDALTEYFGRAFETTMAALTSQGAHPSGPALALYHGVPTDTVDVTAGFLVAQHVTATPNTVVTVLPEGPAVQAMHVGPYETLEQTYAEVTAWMAEHKLTPARDMWEEYLVGPETTPDPAGWQTRITFPLALPQV